MGMINNFILLFVQSTFCYIIINISLYMLHQKLPIVLIDLWYIFDCDLI